MRLIAGSLVLLALVSCSRTANDQVSYERIASGTFAPGPVGGEISRGEALPFRFASERLDLKHKRQLELDAGDLDADGDVDLVALPYDSAPTVFWNDGNGEFNTSLVLTDLDEMDEVHLADFNGDGALDIEAHDVLHPLHVLLNQGNSSFSPHHAIGSRGDLIREVLVTEWDDQPGAEIIWSIDNPDALYVARLRPAGWKVSALVQSWDWNGTSIRLDAADVNMDGRPDLLLLHTNMIYLQLQDGTLQESPLEDQGISIEGTGDFDADGRCDLLVSRPDEGLTILSRDANGEWRGRGSFPVHGPYRDVLLADLDGNGFKDLCVQQRGFYSMGCWGGQEGWMSKSNWQVLLRDPNGWMLRESEPVEDWIYFPGVIASFDAGPYPDLIVQDEEGIGVGLVRDPFRP